MIDIKNKFAVFSALCALFVLISASRQVVESCRYGLTLCVELILPSLFPFFIVSTLLSGLGFPARLGHLLAPAAARLFRVSGAGATALLIGLTGGYPMGAAYLASLVKNGSLHESECEKLLGFCNNSGPAFLIGAIGTGVFNSSAIGLQLYIIHILAAVLTGVLLRGRPIPSTVSENRTPPAPSSLSVLLPEAVHQAVTSLLNVCGFVVCFTVFTGLLDSNGSLSHIAVLLASHTPLDTSTCRALLIGFWELGGGIGAMRGLPPTAFNLAVASAVVSWGGISVHFQTLAVLSETNIKGTLHTAGRLIHAILSFLLTLGWMLLKN